LFFKYFLLRIFLEVVGPVGHNRLVNGILGLLCRLHFLGVVWMDQGDAARYEPAWTWAH
jgi:hypothetical protein